MTGKAKTTAKKRPRGKAFAVGTDSRRNLEGAPVMEARIGIHLLKELEKTPEGYEAMVNNAILISQNMVKRARADDEQSLAYIKEIADRTEGKPTQKTELTGANGKDLTLHIYKPEKYEDPDKLKE